MPSGIRVLARQRKVDVDMVKRFADDDGMRCIAAEQKQIGTIQAGTHHAGWVDGTLRRLNCEIIG